MSRRSPKPTGSITRNVRNRPGRRSSIHGSPAVSSDSRSGPKRATSSFPLSSHTASPKKFQLATRLTFRYRKDKRYEPDLSTTDIGAAFLGRFYVFDPVYLQAEVERLNWDYVARTEEGYETVEDTYTGYYVGFGFVQNAGGRVAMYMSFLWDFAYDKNEPSPNTNPWLIRIGFGYTF